MTQVTIWGARGSLPVTDPDVVRYGGNTPCVEIHGDQGTVLVLDAGTGIRRLGRQLATSETRQIHLLLTHLHFDHIQGLGFFNPLFDSRVTAHIWGPASTTEKLQGRLSRYLSPPLFPIRLRDLPCEIVTHEITRHSFQVGEFQVTAMLVCHPGPTVGYRIEAADGVAVYIPDHEPALGVREFPLSGRWTSGYALAAGADLLIHDAQYDDEEYPHYVGWGHSTMTQAVQFATLAGVRHLVPFHHEPRRNDEALDDFFAPFLAATTYPFRITPAVERLTLDLGKSHE